MAVLKAWPNLKFLGDHRKIEANVFSTKLDHGMDFSHLISSKLQDLNLPPTRIKRVTKVVSHAGLVVTDYYELHYTEEDATIANIVLAEDLGYRNARGW